MNTPILDFLEQPQSGHSLLLALRDAGLDLPPETDSVSIDMPINDVARLHVSICLTPEKLRIVRNALNALAAQASS